MKKILSTYILFVCITLVYANKQFRFALFTDLHIQMINDQPDEDLQNAVNEVNSISDIDFVIISGDVTETGDLASLKKAKNHLDKLKMPYYITLGNHETKWSESGATDFSHVFGDDKFIFEHKGIVFIGFATGPVIKMGDGHIAPQDIDWVNEKLSGYKNNNPVVAITHYPLQTGDVDNWYDMTDILRKFNIQAVLGGHYHRNVIFDYDGLPGIINRSTLRANNDVGGYTIYSVSDSINVFEKIIGQKERKWLSIPIEQKKYDAPDKSLLPTYEVNDQNNLVEISWLHKIRIAIYTSPLVYNGKLYFGDDDGNFHCFGINNGTQKWKFSTGSRIISSPTLKNKKVVFGSTDGNIYCLNSGNGKLIWKYTTSKAVLGCPIIRNDTVYIGGSDGKFRAINLSDGKLIWEFSGLKNYVETRPVIANNKVIFGAWDTYMYAINCKDGSLAWKWNNGKTGMHYSPAAVLPVIANGKVFFTAPDRFWTALDVETGKVIWRTNAHEVRETIGVSKNGKIVYSRCMNDSVVAINAYAETPQIVWKTNAAYGYDHNPSMLIENDGVIIFGTKNGVLVGINAKNGKLIWQYKIGNSIINTIAPVTKNEFVITTTEGVVAKIKYKKK